jgi:hypothetical protein
VKEWRVIMVEINRQIENEELLRAIKDSIHDARDSVRKLAEVFSDNVQPLRLEESESVFMNLTQNINDLQHFLEFVKELKNGIDHLNGFDLPPDPMLSNGSALNLFKDMYSAFKSKDWIMLSDLIEYELSPLLLKEDEWLGMLNDKLAGIGT